MRSSIQKAHFKCPYEVEKAVYFLSLPLIEIWRKPADKLKAEKNFAFLIDQGYRLSRASDKRPGLCLH